MWNEIGPILVTRVLSNNKKNKDKKSKTLASPSKNTDEKEKEKKNTGNCKVFALHAKAKKVT